MKYIPAILLSLLLFPVASDASTYTSYRYKETQDDSLLISQGTVEDMDTFNCSIQALNCTKTANTSLATSDPFSLESTITKSFSAPTGTAVILEKKLQQQGIIKQYFLADSANVAKPQALIPISDEITQAVFAQGISNKVAFITAEGKDKKKQIIFYDLGENKEISRITTSDQITNPMYAAGGTIFAYYVPAQTNISKTKKYKLLQITEDGLIQEKNHTYTVPKAWELLTDANRLHNFSNDGSMYAYLDDQNNYPTPKVMNVADLNFTSASTISWPDLGVVADLLFTRDNNLLIVANSKSRPYDWSVYQVNMLDKSHEEVMTDVSLLYEMKKLSNGQILIPITKGSNLKPILYDPDTKSTHSFSGLNWDTSTSTNQHEVITFADKSFGVFISAKGSVAPKSQPLIVWLHGGPFRQAAKEFHSYPSYATYDWMLAEAVANGALVLKVDYPGSYGYGNDYAYSLLGKDGTVDSLSVMNAVRELQKSKQLTGPVYAVGNSYGGYLAAKLITDYPDEIKQAIAINGVYEWRTLLNYLHTSIFNIHFDGLYDPEETTPYDASSISQRLDRLTEKNKITVVVGTQDKTINPDQAYTFVELLKLKKKNVEQLLLLGEDHILRKKESNEILCQQIFKELKLKISSETCSL
ncbi:MAG: prolyl oligopeptidase family serine peptidase [Candidatus Abawacabacteria bacterium]|nr:prolyl oligopeptidase family serine peptidase [Candidatus Abawacabacteria bacterium]